MSKHHKIKQREWRNKLFLATWLFLFLFGLITTMSYEVKAEGPTTLSPWDLFVVTVNGDPDFIQIITKKEINTGTTIYLSDNAWSGDNTRRKTEWFITMNITSVVPAWTVLSLTWTEWTGIALIESQYGNLTRTWTTLGFNLATAGENILIYQWNSHDDTNSNFVYWVGFWTTSPRITTWNPTANNSYLPSNLVLWTNSLNYNKTHRNIQYTCVNTWMYNENFAADITDITNWTWNNKTNWDFWPIICAFDAIRPQAEISLAIGQAASITWSTGKFLFAFSEAINTGTFTCDDISLSGTAPGKQCISIDEISPNDGTSFEVTVSATNTWTITVDLAENKVEDLAKNPNTSSILTENTLQITYTVYLKYTPWANWTLSGDVNQEFFAWKDWTPVEAIANTWYHFVNRSDGNTTNPRTDLNVTTDIDVIANFAAIYNLQYSAGPNGTVTGNLNQTVQENNDWTPVTAIADTWYYFVKRSDGNTDNPRTDLNVTNNINVTANFAAIYNLQYSADSNGTVTGNLNQTVQENNDWTPVTAIANAWYHFVNRSDGNNNNPRTDLNVTANIAVSAIFERNAYSGGGGSISRYLPKDSCPNGDFSPNHYDWLCWDEKQENEKQLDEKQENEIEYESATDNKKERFMYSPIKRYQLAIFIWIITNDLLKWNEQNKIECDFEDIKNLDEKSKQYILYSCKHWIMWVNADGLTSKKQFDPRELVSYNELATVLSRLLYGTKYNYETVWYEKHVEQMEKIWLLNINKNDLITIESVAQVFVRIYNNPNMVER